MRVGVIVEDAGASRAIAPVVARLRARGADVHGTFGPAAATAFAGIAECATADEVIASSGVLVTGSSCWGERLEAKAILAARARAVPCVTFIDAWSNYRPRLSYPGERDMAAVGDVVAVIDSYMRAGLVRDGVDDARITITGSPAFDAFLGAPTLADAAKESPAIVFLSQPLSKLYPGGKLDERVALRALAAAAPAGIKIVVRPHPREERGGLADLLATLPARAALSEHAGLAEDLTQASVVVGVSTMALIEAATRGRFTIALSLGHPLGIDWQHVLDAGLLVEAPSPERLRQLLNEAIAARGRRDVAGALGNLGWSSGATDRLADVIERSCR